MAVKGTSRLRAPFFDARTNQIKAVCSTLKANYDFTPEFRRMVNFTGDDAQVLADHLETGHKSRHFCDDV